MSDAQEFWIVSVPVDSAALERNAASEQLSELSPHPLVELETPGDQQLWLEGYFDSEIEARLALGVMQQLYPELPSSLRHCPGKDWSTFWRHHFQTRRIGERLRIVPEWLRVEEGLDPQRHTIYIEPGLSFGTGDHFTTQFCLEVLDRLAGEGRQAAGVLDAGCGSAILGIAAHHLGWREILGVDHDAVAIQSAQENLQRNGVEGAIQLRCMDLTREWPSGKFPLVLANMYGGLLMELAPQLIRSCGRDLVLSGIRSVEADMLSDTFARLGTRERLCHADHEWCGLWLELPAT